MIEEVKEQEVEATELAPVAVPVVEPEPVPDQTPIILDLRQQMGDLSE